MNEWGYRPYEAPDGGGNHSGVSTSVNDDGTTHVTVWDTELGRFSWDVGEDGRAVEGSVHSTNLSDEHISGTWKW